MDINTVADAGFEDMGDASDWAVEGINFCYASGVMNGTNASPLLFSPKSMYTRQESIVTLDRIN